MNQRRGDTLDLQKRYMDLKKENVKLGEELGFVKRNGCEGYHSNSRNNNYDEDGRPLTPVLEEAELMMMDENEKTNSTFAYLTRQKKTDTLGSMLEHVSSDKH